MPAEFDAIYRAWKEGKYSIREAAEKAGMNYSAFYRRSRERMENEKAVSDSRLREIDRVIKYELILVGEIHKRFIEIQCFEKSTL